MIDCNACEFGWELGAIAQKIACHTTAKLFDAFLPIYASIDCTDTSKNLSKGEDINKAKELLLSKTSFFTREELDKIDIKLCSVKLRFSEEDDFFGMTPEPNKILLNPNNISENITLLATELAHEIYHIKQYNEWSNDKYKCIYASELLLGHDIGYDNIIEKDAYLFQFKIEDILLPNKGIAESE